MFIMLEQCRNVESCKECPFESECYVDDEESEGDE